MALQKPLVIPSSGVPQQIAEGDAISVAHGGTGLVSPGASGNVLTSNGTEWTSVPVDNSEYSQSFLLMGA